MRLGPVHVLSHRTWQYLAEAVTANCPSFTVHPTPSTTRTLPVFFCEPDAQELSREAAARVIAAYHKAAAEEVSPGLSFWQCVDRIYEDLVTPLKEKRVDEVQKLLSRMLQLNLTCGVARKHPGELEALRKNGSGKSRYHLRLTDSIVNLAEAVGASRRPCIEQQGYDAYFHSLDTDLEGLVDRIERLTGFDIAHPQVGGALGYRIGAKLLTCDSMNHSYTAYRLRALGADLESRIVEIGGGYGCLAGVVARAGHRHYEVYDLPWVNALQGYFLIMSLGPDRVQLFGEADADVKVLPFWRFHELPDHSVDYVVNTDSLPEIGHKTAKEYVARIQRILRRLFLSINQETQATPELSAFGVDTTFDPQNRVFDLINEAGGMQLRSRHPWWMREGYVEEVYAPLAARA